jgi:hypothetical protein
LAEQKCHAKNSTFISRTVAPVQQEDNIVDYKTLKEAVGMTKNQVKEKFGIPRDASDHDFSYDVIQPDTGKEGSCLVRFYHTTDVVGQVIC